MEKTKNIKLESYAIRSDWFITRGHINGKFCFGYGKTKFASIMDAFRDYKVIMSL